MENKQSITIHATVNAPVAKVWGLWILPEHITQWNTASPDWHTPRAENDLRPGGKFVTRMEARDGSFGFDFGGTYDAVKLNELITYTMDDGRTATNIFTSNGNTTDITITFDAENENPIEMQRDGWQAILDNFKKYTESN